jgi:hypothetical protein
MEAFNNNLGHINTGKHLNRNSILFIHQGQQFFNDVLINGKPPVVRLEKAFVPKIDPLVDQGESRVDQDGKQHPENGEHSGKYLGICKIGHNAPPCGKDFCVPTKSYHIGGLFIYEGVKGGAA